MVTALVKRVTDRPPCSLFRLSSYTLFQNLSTSAPSPAPDHPVSSNNPKRKKKKNLFEVAQFLPNWGIGYHMAKTHWTGVSYQITKLNLYKDGLPAAEAPKKISGVHKRCWRYIPNLPKTLTEAPKQQLEAA